MNQHNSPIMDSDFETHNFGNMDIGVIQAIVNYITMGLHPGSFATSLLLQDWQKCCATAHPLLGPDSVNPRGICTRMFKFCELNVPLATRGGIEKIQQWINHDGLIHKPPCRDWDQMMVNKKLSMGYIWWELPIN